MDDDEWENEYEYLWSASAIVKENGRLRRAKMTPYDDNKWYCDRADHLLFFHFDYDQCVGEVVYNGPEEPVRQTLPPSWIGQRSVGAATFRRLDKLVNDNARLPMILHNKD